jgi:hypothetical protein
MRLLTSVAVLALLAGPAVAQNSNPIEPAVDPVDTAAEPNAVDAAAEPAGRFRDVDVVVLEDTEVVNIEGEELGEIENVVRGPSGNLMAVMEFGGFLDIGEEKRLIDLSRMYWRDDDLVLPGMTEAELEALPEWQDDLDGYVDVADTDDTRIGIYTEADPTETGAIGTNEVEPAIDPIDTPAEPNAE